MERTYRDNKEIGRVIEQLVNEGGARLVQKDKYLEIYSIESPAIAIVSRWGIDRYSVSRGYTLIGREEDIGEFERLVFVPS